MINLLSNIIPNPTISTFVSEYLMISLIVVGIVISLFFGFNAEKIFSSSAGTWSGKIYQFWFNFCGSLFGWFALVWLFFTNSTEYSLFHLLVTVFAFYGITGHLPYVSILSAQSLANIIKKYLQ